MRFENTTKEAKEKRSALKRDMTDGEKKFWKAVRRKSFGFRFRPQFPIGSYILDFYCARLRLCIEIDGDHHVERLKADAARDQFLMTLGIETVRFNSWDIAREFDQVLIALDSIVESRRQSLNL